MFKIKQFSNSELEGAKKAIMTYMSSLSSADRKNKFGGFVSEKWLLDYSQASLNKSDGVWLFACIEHHSGVEVIGEVKVFGSPKSGLEMSISVSPNHRGKGIAVKLTKEALLVSKELGANTLVSITKTKNDAMNGLTKKFEELVFKRDQNEGAGALNYTRFDLDKDNFYEILGNIE